MIFTTKTGSTYNWDEEGKTLQRMQVGVNSEDLGIEEEILKISHVSPEPSVGIRPTFFLLIDAHGRTEYLTTSEVRSIDEEGDPNDFQD